MVNLPVAELVRRYGAGETTPQLAAAFGVAKSTMSLRLKAAGVRLRGYGGNCRKYYGRISPDSDGYWRSADRSAKLRFIHRACWEAVYGPIPARHIIHHRDRDRDNNDITNLACLSRKAHILEHGREPNGWFG